MRIKHLMTFFWSILVLTIASNGGAQGMTSGARSRLMMMDGHMMTPFGWIFMLVFWVLVTVAVVYGVRWLAGRSRPDGDRGRRAPIDVLKERYARGEISREDFERMKKDLE